VTTDTRVDAYLATLPSEQRELLQALRERVAALAPEAEETFSYGMPTFKRDNRFLLSYAGWKRHCSIYPVGDDVFERHADALRGHGRSKSSLHFTSARPLPAGLLEDIVRGGPRVPTTDILRP
jgi:uncharacterized protein YdhG (YjbR/CyaY superfamily)